MPPHILKSSDTYKKQIHPHSMLYGAVQNPSVGGAYRGGAKTDESMSNIDAIARAGFCNKQGHEGGVVVESGVDIAAPEFGLGSDV